MPEYAVSLRIIQSQGLESTVGTHMNKKINKMRFCVTVKAIERLLFTLAMYLHNLNT